MYFPKKFFRDKFIGSSIEIFNLIRYLCILDIIIYDYLPQEVILW